MALVHKHIGISVIAEAVFGIVIDPVVLEAAIRTALDRSEPLRDDTSWRQSFMRYLKFALMPQRPALKIVKVWHEPA